MTRLINTYSEFISFPIQLWQTKETSKEVENEEATKQAQEFADKKAEEEGKVRMALLFPVCGFYAVACLADAAASGTSACVKAACAACCVWQHG